MKQATLLLPWPPTVNTYWRMVTIKGRARMMISQKGREYRKAIQMIFIQNKHTRFEDARLRVTINAFPPDKRRRDLDNLPKAVLDALQKAGIFSDDSNIDDLRIVRQERKKPGRLSIQIEAIGDTE